MGVVRVMGEGLASLKTILIRVACTGLVMGVVRVMGEGLVCPGTLSGEGIMAARKE